MRGNNGFLGVVRILAVAFVAAVLVACGGGGGDSGGSGGGGGGGGNGNATSLQLSTNAVAFSVFAGDNQFESKTVQVSWTGSRVAGFAVATLPGQTLPTWLTVSGQGSSSPSTITISRFSGSLPVGRYTTTLRVATGDSSQNIIDTADFTVTLDVLAAPTIAPNPVSLTWVESEQPAATALTVAHDSRATLTSASVDVDWISVSTSGDTITLSGNAKSQQLEAGTATGTLTAAFNVAGVTRTITTPISANVNQALSSQTPTIVIEVNASTVASSLSSYRATVTSATQAPVTVNAQVDAPWLTVTGGSSASANNVSLVIDPAKLDQLPNGTHYATISASAPNISELAILVELRLRLPEANFVAPVAFTDTVASEEVIVRGSGFDGLASANFQIDGAPINGGHVVNDTEFRFVPGAHTAGEYTVSVPNALGFVRGSAKLRVTDPPAYGNFSMAAPYGAPVRIISSPINSAVFAQLCYFCQANSSAASSTVYRYEYQSGTGSWVLTQHGYANLFDIALSPDESELFVLTASQLMIVDPQTMHTIKSVTLPDPATGTSRQLAVMNNGLVIIGSLGRAYDLVSGLFTDPIANFASEQIEASRDGSRAINGSPTTGGNVAYRYFDATSGSMVVSNTFQYFVQGHYSRRAERAYVNGLVVNKDLTVRGTLSPFVGLGATVSPDGKYVYGVDLSTSTNPKNFRIFDVSGAAPFSELTPIPLNISGSVSVEADPHGDVAFVIDGANFMVVDLP